MTRESTDWRPTSIPGALRRTATSVLDGRGSFGELWRETATGPLTGEAFVQANLSRSDAGVLRGLHLHRHQWDLWAIVSGEGVAGLVDVRPALTAEPPAAERLLTTEIIPLSPGAQLLIPPFVAHGFYARTPFVMVYLVTREYDGTDEWGFAWNDPDAAVAWPEGSPILSERDAANPSLSEMLARLRAASAEGQGQPAAR